MEGGVRLCYTKGFHFFPSQYYIGWWLCAYSLGFSFARRYLFIHKEKLKLAFCPNWFGTPEELFPYIIEAKAN